MEHQLWKAIVALLATLDKPRARRRHDFSDVDIVSTFYWAVLHDRPVTWAIRLQNWPIWLRKRTLPSDTTMSRRLRTPKVRRLLDALEQRVVAPKEPGLFWIIDGKPLPIGGCSKDKQAGYGRSAGGKAKGYKIHAILSPRGEIAEWRVAPMNKDERVMAERMLKSANIHGYVIGDSNFDSNKLHAVCDARSDLRLITRRRYGPTQGTGHRQQTAGRLRCIERVENPFPEFAEALLEGRTEIERQFGHWTCWGGGLAGLPAWVRGHRRVTRWIQAKLVLTRLRKGEMTTTYVA